MNIRRFLCLALALTLALGCAGALAEDDLQAQLDAANERIAELEEQVELYKPYYMAQIVATYGDGEIVWLDDVQAQYDAVNAQYQNMGMSLESYGMVDTVKKSIVDSAVETGVLLDKATELGLDQYDEAREAEFQAQAEEQMEQYISYYINYFYSDAEEITDDMRAEAEDYWKTNGMTLDDLVTSLKQQDALDAVYDYATRDVAVTEDDVQAAYEALIDANKESYADDRTYNSDRSSGVAIAWNPEGYRAVKHVLIKFDDEQTQLYSDLQSQLSSLNAERDAVENPTADATADAAADATNEPTETPEPRSLEEIDADISACAAEVEALYAQLLPTAQEVIDAFNDGTDFDELIEKYNEDPGMENEPTASEGYAVCAGSTYWEQAFTDGAMSIASIGEISEPVYGSNGIHIIYYMADIEPGEVGLDAIRDSVEQSAQEQKLANTYEEQVHTWTEEANAEYFYENFGISEAA